MFLCLSFFLTVGMAAQAQNPFFTVNWNSNCDVHSMNSYYKISWALIHIPTQNVLEYGEISHIDLINASQVIVISNWSCDKDDILQNYRILVRVERYQGDNLTVDCSGDGRSSAKTCADLYDGVTLTVNMTHP